MENPPIRDKEELERATSSQLALQLRYELQHLLDVNGFKQDALGLALGFSQAAVSRWKVGTERVLSAAGAEALDRGFTLDGQFHKPATTLEVTWYELVALHRVRQQSEGGDRSSRTKRPAWQVFLASPIAALEDPDEYLAERSAALDLKAAIENHCGLSVYYAGETVPTLRELQLPEAAAEINFAALSEARYFVLLVTQSLNRPSSVFAEAGFALARGIPSLYFCYDPRELPFCLRNLTQHTVPHLPPVNQYFKSSVGEVTDFIKANGKETFDRLATKPRRTGT
jgi:hypothetical protein